MYDQPKIETFERSDLWPDGASARRMPEGTLAQEDTDAPQQMPSLSRAFLARGHERFNIYCAPCHSVAGDGDGMVPARGFPQPPSYHSARLRSASDRHFYDVISQGWGVMYPYAARVAPGDRWAIVAYIRALQLSQNATLDEVPTIEQAKLERAP
jgi:mono/diheme cytochrome c family protein